MHVRAQVAAPTRKHVGAQADKPYEPRVALTEWEQQGGGEAMAERKGRGTGEWGQGNSR